MMTEPAARSFSVVEPRDRPVPHSEQLERLALQYIVEHPEHCAAAFVAAGVHPDLFRNRDLRIYLRIALDLHAAGIEPQWPYVQARFMASGESLDDPIAFDGFTDGVPRPILANIPKMIAELAALRRQRDALAALSRMESEIYAPGADVDAALEALIGACRESQTAAVTPFSESLPVMAARLAEAFQRDMAIDGLLALGEIGLLHGPPRASKTWLLILAGACIATGSALLSLPQFAIPRPRRVLYATSEDSAARTVQRATEIVAGLGYDVLPDAFRLRIGGGMWLDDPAQQRRLIDEARAEGIEVVIIEPLRSLTICVDQGPRELQPLARFLRQELIAETGVALLAGHHDTKLAAGVTDTRRRAQRASGGGIFSIADAPLHVEPISETRVLLTPDAFKHAETPGPLVVTREHGPGWVRFSAEPAGAKEPEAIALHERIVEYLRHSPGKSGSAVASGLRARKDDVLAALQTLSGADQVDSVHEGRSIRWFTKPAQKGTVPHGSH